MTVAIVHYHLGSGGVSRVIATTSRALTSAGIPNVILAGPTPEPVESDLPTVLVPGLEYNHSRGPHTPQSLLARLTACATAHLGAPPDVWHFHNHSLGKNPLVPDLVALLAAAGQRLVLQIHDLAEDGRPENRPNISACPALYPVTPRIRYAFLTPRDQSTFLAAGLPPENSTLLPNPIPETRAAPPPPDGPPRLLYPVRGIRRKNLGEFLLLTILSPPGTTSAITRAPANPQARQLHDQWQRFAQHHHIPAEFDVVDRTPPAPGDTPDFQSWIDRSTHLVTTSVCEGFGMVHLEAAAIGRTLIGRHLPHATASLPESYPAGTLYDRLMIPADWIDRHTLDRFLTLTLGQALAAWHRPCPAESLATARNRLCSDGFLDFGNLPEPLQKHILTLALDPANQASILVSHPGGTTPAPAWLGTTLAHSPPTVPPAQLAAISTTSLDTLTRTYHHLAHAPAAPPTTVPPERILDTCLTPENFRFLTAPDVSRRPAPDLTTFRAVVFDVYGTLLDAPAGGVKPDPDADPRIAAIIRHHGLVPPEHPTQTLADAVRAHHRNSTEAYPEVDLLKLWRQILRPPASIPLEPLLNEIENTWHPATWIPGAPELLAALNQSGTPLGLLSNAQHNTLHTLGHSASLFDPALTILSYRHGAAKPSPRLFQTLARALAMRGIQPSETLFVGNDPLQDIIPASIHGFQTALFTGHPGPQRPGTCLPDYEITSYSSNNCQHPELGSVKDEKCGATPSNSGYLFRIPATPT
ncbi:MAG: HAD family hydrolase [Verrucomicrobiales bacterium]